MLTLTGQVSFQIVSQVTILYTVTFTALGFSACCRGYINYYSVYLFWLGSAVFVHLPSFQSMGIDVKADISMLLTILLLSLLVRTHTMCDATHNDIVDQACVHDKAHVLKHVRDNAHASMYIHVDHGQARTCVCNTARVCSRTSVHDNAQTCTCVSGAHVVPDLSTG